MTEEALNQGESVEETAGTDVPPSADVSTQPEQPSLDAAALVAALQENPDFLSFVDNRVQSVKDKRFQKLEDKTDDFESKLAELREIQKTFGFTEEQAMEFQKRTQKSVVQPEVSGSTEVEAKEFDRDGFAKGLGLDPNDSRIARMSQLEMAQYAVERASKPKPAPSAAQNMPSSSGSSVSSRDLADVEAEIKRLSVNPSQNWARLKKLQEEHTEILNNR
jgi:hypothetical protein